MSNRITSQEGSKTAKSRAAPDFYKFNVHDSYCNSITNLDSAGGEEQRRISRQQLEEISSHLSERDSQIITALQRHRYLLTSQIRRLYFTDAATPTAGLRAASRTLKKLRERGRPRYGVARQNHQQVREVPPILPFRFGTVGGGGVPAHRLDRSDCGAEGETDRPNEERF